MKKKGFATTGILYTLLLLFVGLLFGVLQNLQNKKTILDNLKMDTVNALACDCDTILSKLDNIENKVSSGGGAELEILKSLGDATAEDILEGKTAVVQGELVTGSYKNSMPSSISFSVTIANGSAVDYAALYNMGYTNMQVTSSGLYTIGNYKKDITGTNSVSNLNQFSVTKESSGSVTCTVTFSK